VQSSQKRVIRRWRLGRRE